MLNPSATLRAEKTPYASNSEFSELLGELKAQRGVRTTTLYS
jgi:hypothetical protein